MRTLETFGVLLAAGVAAVFPSALVVLTAFSVLSLAELARRHHGARHTLTSLTPRRR